MTEIMNLGIADGQLPVNNGAIRSCQLCKTFSAQFAAKHSIQVTTRLDVALHGVGTCIGQNAVANKTKALQRSKAHLEKLGWQVAIVEKWIPPRGKMKFGVRIDVWGIGDLLACKPSCLPEPNKIALIQCFPLARWKDHVVKIESIVQGKIWKAAGGIILIHGWALKPKDGIRGAKKVWTLREQEI